MPKGIPTNPKIKAEIVGCIRDHGMSVREASEKFGVNTRLVNHWLHADVRDGSKNLILENNRLKKKLEIAERVIGEMALELRHPKS